MATIDAAPPVPRRRSVWSTVLRNPSVIFGGSIALVMLIVAILAPVLGTRDPAEINPSARNQ